MGREDERLDRVGRTAQQLVLLLGRDDAGLHCDGELVVNDRYEHIDEGFAVGALRHGEIGERLTFGEGRDDVAPVHVEELDRRLPQQSPDPLEVATHPVTHPVTGVVGLEDRLVDSGGDPFHERGGLLLARGAGGDRLVGASLGDRDECGGQRLPARPLRGGQVGQCVALGERRDDLSPVDVEDLHRVTDDPGAEPPDRMVRGDVRATIPGTIRLTGERSRGPEQHAAHDEDHDETPTDASALQHELTPFPGAVLVHLVSIGAGCLESVKETYEFGWAS